MSSHEAIPLRTLRNDVSDVMRRVEAGESFDVTRHGRPVARIVPVGSDRRMKSVAEFRASSRSAPADPELRQLIRELRSQPTRDPFERRP
jgi:prevent-host-death family protein